MKVYALFFFSSCGKTQTFTNFARRKKKTKSLEQY